MFAGAGQNVIAFQRSEGVKKERGDKHLATGAKQQNNVLLQFQLNLQSIIVKCF
jgi:hypothetical protein